MADRNSRDEDERDRERRGSFDIDGSRNQQYGAGPTTEFNGTFGPSKPPDNFSPVDGGVPMGNPIDPSIMDRTPSEGTLNDRMERSLGFDKNFEPTAPWGGAPTESLGDVLNDIDRGMPAAPGFSKPTSQAPGFGRQNVAMALSSAFGDTFGDFGNFGSASQSVGSRSSGASGFGSASGGYASPNDDPFGEGGWASDAFGDSFGGTGWG